MQGLEPTTPFDAAAYVADDETACALLREALEHGDGADLADALQTIRRARAHLLADTGEAEPTAAALVAVVQRLGLKLTLAPAAA